MRKQLISLPLLAILLSFSSCGGGGGGGDPFYGGIWRFLGSLRIDSCSVRPPESATSTITVNQDGTRVVAESGSTNYTGETVPEDDGFVVTGEVPTNTPGCATAAAWVFQDASGDDARVGFGLATVCSDGSECEVGYGGTATRNSNRTTTSDTLSVDSLAEILTQAAFSAHGPALRADNADVAVRAQEIAESSLRE